MKLKKATLIVVIFIFLLNFILIGGYFKYFLIPQLSIAIEANNDQLNDDLIEILGEVKISSNLYKTIDKFAKDKKIDIYIERLDGTVIYNNNNSLWNKGSISHVTKFFEYNDNIYIIKLHKETNTEDIPALNNFIIFEIIVILVIVLIFLETTNQRVFSPVERLQKSIKNYKFGIKPSKTSGHSEFDIIQNNFVELVDALEDEKEKQNRIIASISHDIKTPLTSILGYSDRLLNAKLDENRKNDYIEKIHNKAITLRDLTEEFDDYLSCNLKDTLKREDIPINDFLNVIRKDYKDDLAEKGIKLFIQNDCEGEVLHIDSAKMKRVFSNIIANSARYTPKKGKINIKCKKIDKYIEFTISDNGEGVAEKDLNRIFEPLFTSDPSRKISGLGLSICKEIVENHGGYIYARNNENKGLEHLYQLPSIYQVHCVTKGPLKRHDFILHERISDTELNKLYDETSAVIVPSRYEAFSLVALEALSHHTPIIISDRVRIGDYLTGGKGYKIFKYHNYDDFNQSVKEILSSNDIINYNKLLSPFNATLVREKYYHIYNS